MADKKITLDPVEVSWASLQEPKPKYQSEDLEYTIAIKVTDQLRDLMKSYKLNKKIKNKDTTFDGADFIQIGLDAKTKGGWTRTGSVLNMEGQPFTDLIGNGSTMRLFVSIGDSKYGNIIKLGHLDTMDQDNKAMSFTFGQVRNLVSYESSSAVVIEKSVNQTAEESLEVELED